MPQIVGRQIKNATITADKLASGIIQSFVDKETPAGLINGTNTVFTLVVSTPVAGSEQVYLNGLLQESGAGKDYTIADKAITFTTAPATGDVVFVWYRK